MEPESDKAVVIERDKSGAGAGGGSNRPESVELSVTPPLIQKEANW